MIIIIVTIIITNANAIIIIIIVPIYHLIINEITFSFRVIIVSLADTHSDGSEVATKNVLSLNPESRMILSDEGGKKI